MCHPTCDTSSKFKPANVNPFSSEPCPDSTVGRCQISLSSKDFSSASKQKQQVSSRNDSVVFRKNYPHTPVGRGCSRQICMLHSRSPASAGEVSANMIMNWTGKSNTTQPCAHINRKHCFPSPASLNTFSGSRYTGKHFPDSSQPPSDPKPWVNRYDFLIPLVGSTESLCWIRGFQFEWSCFIVFWMLFICFINLFETLPPHKQPPALLESAGTYGGSYCHSTMEGDYWASASTVIAVKTSVRETFKSIDFVRLFAYSPGIWLPWILAAWSVCCKLSYNY